MANLKDLRPGPTKKPNNVNALTQFDIAVAIATPLRGYSDVDGGRNQYSDGEDFYRRYSDGKFISLPILHHKV